MRRGDLGVLQRDRDSDPTVAARFAVPLDGNRQRPQARGNLAGGSAAPSPWRARPRLRNEPRTRRSDSAGAVVIGVLVLTGFLGSGKTTLLRHLLRQPEFSRTAVIINEFGEIGLDHDLVAASADSFIESSTGGLSCTVRSDLAGTLDDMLHRRDRGTAPPSTRVVLHTT